MCMCVGHVFLSGSSHFVCTVARRGAGGRMSPLARAMVQNMRGQITDLRWQARVTADTLAIQVGRLLVRQGASVTVRGSSKRGQVAKNPIHGIPGGRLGVASCGLDICLLIIGITGRTPCC